MSKTGLDNKTDACKPELKSRAENLLAFTHQRRAFLVEARLSNLRETPKSQRDGRPLAPASHGLRDRPRRAFHVAVE